MLGWLAFAPTRTTLKATASCDFRVANETKKKWLIVVLARRRDSWAGWDHRHIAKFYPSARWSKQNRPWLEAESQLSRLWSEMRVWRKPKQRWWRERHMAYIDVSSSLIAHKSWKKKSDRWLTVSRLLEVDIGIAEWATRDEIATDANAEHWPDGRELLEELSLSNVLVEISDVEWSHFAKKQRVKKVASWARWLCA